MPAGVSLCGLCSQSHTTGDVKRECKSCQNISLYRDNKEKLDHEMREKNDNIQEQQFPGPCEIRTNQTFGNYIVASRRIEEGELISREEPMFVGPYGPSDLLPYCIGCYKDIGLSSKCTKCKWPVCNLTCENISFHANYECKVLSDNNIRPKGSVAEYFCLEVLRCILSREKYPEKWARLQEMEPHFEARRQDVKAVETLNIITDFIRSKCKLTEVREEDIDRVVGVLSINTFWAKKDINRYASLLFDKISLLAHDCDPNTRREIVRLEMSGGDDVQKDSFGIEIQIYAARTIEKGEVISIQYVNPEKPVRERRAELKEIFYFDCCCNRCLVELMEESKLNGNSNPDANANTW